MDVRRATYGAAIRLAMVFSAMAAAVAIGLDTIGEVSTTRFVVAVVAVGFWASWVQTGKVQRRVEHHSAHRMASLPLRQPIA